VLVVENNIGWISKDVAKEIDDLTRQLIKVNEYLGPWTFITNAVSQALVFFGFGKEQELLPFKEDVTS
jgi:hypothetical protein